MTGADPRQPYQAWLRGELLALTPWLDGDGGLLPGPNRSQQHPVAQRAEGFVRALWGAAPLLAGGDGFADWPRWLEQFARALDPANPRGWGVGSGWGDFDQRHVEMGSLAALVLRFPQVLLDPLSATTRGHLVQALSWIDGPRVPDNNWLWFRIACHLARRRLGAAWDAAQVAVDADRLLAMGAGEGWVLDGHHRPDASIDWYNSMALQFYPMVLLPELEAVVPAQAQAFREQVRRWAPGQARWFAADGAGLPFGRSLTYRWAMAAGFGAAAAAGVEALPCSALRGLWQRHLEWWRRRDCWRRDGTQSLGFAYELPLMAEGYSCAGSPYWSWKSALPLALPATHPFWAAPADMPAFRPRCIQVPTRMIIEDVGGSVQALCGGWAKINQFRHVPHKYAKFACSTHFAFGVPGDPAHDQGCAPDSALLLSEDGRAWRHPVSPELIAIDADVLHRRWQAWADVLVDTWLIPDGAWHVRIHRIVSARPLRSLEGGWCVDAELPGAVVEAATPTQVGLRWPGGSSAIADLSGVRRAESLGESPEQHLYWHRTRVPVLRGEHVPGATWLACAVFGHPGGDEPSPCTARCEAGGIVFADGRRVSIAGMPSMAGAAPP